MARRWNESNHPRHDDGRFKDKLGGGFAKRLSDQIGAQRGEPEAGTKGVHRYSVEIRDGDAPTARMMQNRIANRLAGQSSYLKDSRATFVGVERSGRKGNYKYDVKITGSGAALPPEELQRWTGGAAKRLDADGGGSGAAVETTNRRSTARDIGNVEADRESFVLNMLGEGNSTLDMNDEDDETEQDDDLAGLVEDIETEMAAGRTDGDRALALAKELRRYLVANEYVEDDEITDFDDSAGKPGFAQRISDQVGAQRGEAPRPLTPSLAPSIQRASRGELRRKSTETLQAALISPEISDIQKILIRQVLAERGA